MDISGKVLILSLALAASVALAQALPAESLQAASSDAAQAQAWELFVRANQSRADAGAAPLKWDSALATAARQHCLRMAAEGPISHQYAGEAGISERAARAGAHFSLIEENVAIGPDPATIHSEWMHSPGHRANLLNPAVDRVGLAVVASRDGLYAVADYERAVPVLSPAQVETTVASLMHGITILHDASAARAACSMDEGLPASGARPRFIMRWQGADLTRLPKELAAKLASGQYHQASVGSCPPRGQQDAFTAYRIAVLLY